MSDNIMSQLMPILLIIGLVVAMFIPSFFGYKAIKYLFFKKVYAHIMEKTEKGKYKEIKRIKKKIGTDVAEWNGKTYVLDLTKGWEDEENQHHIEFDKTTCLPLSYNKSDRNDSTLLKTYIKNEVWHGILHGGELGGVTFIVVILMIGVSMALIGYLIYSNNNLSNQLINLENMFNKLNSSGGIHVIK